MMLKCKIKTILVLYFAIQTTAEEVLKVTGNQDTQQDGTTHHNRTSFLSKLTSWFLPAAQSRADLNDLETAATNYGPPQHYGAPSINDCNLCNQSPWVPIIGNKGHYEPSKEISSHILQHNSIENLPGYFNNGPSSLYQPPLQDKYFALSNSHYNLPQSTVHIPDYMIPPPANYKIPVALYGAPQTSYGAPQEYAPPGKPIYRPPPNSVNGPPKPAYGPPSKPVYGPPVAPPKPIYGLPPKTKYGPPSRGPYNSVPNQQYGSPLNIQYGLPKPEYGLPIKPEYDSPPKLTYSNSLGDFVSTSSFGSSSNNYYDAPLALSSPQKGFSGGGLVHSYAASAPSSLGSASLGVKNYHPSYATESSNYINVPSDSYGLPVTSGNIELADAIGASSGDFDEEYAPQIPLPNLSSLPSLPIRNHRNFNKDYVSKSLPLEGKVRGTTDVQIQPSVELANYVASIEYPINIIQSPVVDVSVKEQENKELLQELPHTKSTQVFQNSKEEISQQSVQYSHNIQEELAKNDNEELNSAVSFKDNPIIVEDFNAAASEITNTTTVSKGSIARRNNDKDTAILPHSSEVSSSSNYNKEDTSLFKQLLDEVDKTIETSSKSKNIFTPPPLDYSAWKPTVSNTIATSMVPPPMQTTSSWISQNKNQNRYQIIVPYTNGKKNVYYEKDWSKKSTKWQAPKDTYTTLGSVYSPPMPTEESLWVKFMEDLKSTETKRLPATGFTQPTTIAYNTKDLLGSEDNSKENSVNVPYNMFALQNAIDNWTHQSYATANHNKGLLTSKNIPNLYFPTQPFTTTTERNFKAEVNSNIETTSTTQSSIFSSHGLLAIINSLTSPKESVTLKTSTGPETVKPKKIKQIPDVPRWNTSQITESPQTKEKIYVVTPQSYGFYTSTPATAWSMAPKVENGKVNNGTAESHKFTVRIEADSKKKVSKNDKNSAIKVVYSEWPHLINSLETTTTKATSRHPLLGLMDIFEFTPAPNTTVETFFGHSKVSTVTTTQPTLSVSNSSISS